MSETENKNEFHDDIQEIKEFKVRSEKSRVERKQAELGALAKFLHMSDQKKIALTVLVFCVLAIGYLLAAIWPMQIHPVVACVILMIQAGMGVLLDQNPVWVHAIVLLAELVVGIWLGLTGFMILTMVIYVAGIVSLEIWQKTASK